MRWDEEIDPNIPASMLRHTRLYQMDGAINGRSSMMRETVMPRELVSCVVLTLHQTLVIYSLFSFPMKSKIYRHISHQKVYPLAAGRPSKLLKHLPGCILCCNHYSFFEHQGRVFQLLARGTPATSSIVVTKALIAKRSTVDESYLEGRGRFAKKNLGAPLTGTGTCIDGKELAFRHCFAIRIQVQASAAN